VQYEMPSNEKQKRRAKQEAEGVQVTRVVVVFFKGFLVVVFIKSVNNDREVVIMAMVVCMKLRKGGTLGRGIINGNMLVISVTIVGAIGGREVTHGLYNIPASKFLSKCVRKVHFTAIAAVATATATPSKQIGIS
jgi:hypothetical protein